MCVFSVSPSALPPSSRDLFVGPVLPCPDAEGSVDPPVVGLPVHVEIRFYEMCRDGLLVQGVGGLGLQKKEEIFHYEPHIST